MDLLWLFGAAFVFVQTDAGDVRQLIVSHNITDGQLVALTLSKDSEEENC